MNYASWKGALSRALKSNDDDDWRLADQLLIELASHCPLSIRDIHKLLTLARIRSGYDPEDPEIDGDPSEVWVHHIVAQTCNRLGGTEAIYSSPLSPPIILPAALGARQRRWDVSVNQDGTGCDAGLVT